MPEDRDSGHRHIGAPAVAQKALALLLVTALVAAVAVVTVGISAALGDHGRPPVVALLLAAAVITVALPRVRPSAERLANWIVLGDRADAYELVSDFVRSSASTLPIEEVLPRLAETAARTVRSPRGEVRVWLADGGEWREAWPVSRPEGSAAVNVDVLHEGQAVGELEVSIAPDEAEARAARRRLRALSGPAGLALSTVRLTVDLRRQFDDLARTDKELRASQRRLVEARLEERQRFVGAIDSFVQPHLTAATEALADAATASADDVDNSLTSAARHGQAALESLRSLAHGVFPIVLLQAGLADALEAWAEESGVRLMVRGTGDANVARRNPTAAAVQFFACVEALQHLRPAPSAADVELSQGAGTATLALDWSSAVSSRLDAAIAVALRDRTEAVGGTFVISPGGLRVSVPVEVRP